MTAPKFSKLTAHDERRTAPLTGRDRALLRAETLCADETIDSWSAGRSVRPANDERLTIAARKLGIPLLRTAIAIQSAGRP